LFKRKLESADEDHMQLLNHTDLQVASTRELGMTLLDYL